jgi:hypothetical protein
MASITFGGPDLRTVYLGSLLGTRIPSSARPWPACRWCTGTRHREPQHCNPRSRHVPPIRRPVDLPGKRRAERPAGLCAEDPVLHHDNTFEQIAPFFPGLKREDLPDGEGWAVEMVQLSTHNGTHLDAPYHFHSTMDKALGDKKRPSPSTRCRWSGASSPG